MEAELKRIARRALGALPAAARRLDEQTLAYPFAPPLAWLAVRYARTPSRVLWDFAEISASRLEPLYAGLRSWLEEADPEWMLAGVGFSVEVKRADAFPAGPLQIRGAVKNALLDASATLGRPLVLEPERPTLPIRVEADAGSTWVSLDLAGRSLHRRGHRALVGEASLKETLAAQILVLARWDSRVEALVDPMAGAGTLPLEAAFSAVGAPIWPRGVVPPVGGVPPFRSLDPDAPDLFPGTPPRIAAIEVHTPTYRALTENLARAGMGALVPAIHGDFRSVSPRVLAKRMGLSDLPRRGLVVVNPPYGERLVHGRGRDPELEALYTGLRDWWRGLGPGWRIAILGPGRPLKEVFGPSPRLAKPMKNGPLSVTLLVYDG